jgi:hypothetical protein
VPLVVAASIAAGLVARSWLIVPLAVAVVPIADLRPCDSGDCDYNSVVIALMWVPFAAALLALGAGIGKRSLAGR